MNDILYIEKTIKVSIIIPVYNSSEYLRRVFDSCIYQTLKDIEVITVNDDSPDSRDEKIMREYESNYPNKFICLYNSGEKLGPGGARNMGIRASRGEYFQVVDSDDYIELDMCEKMYCKAVSEKADLTECNAMVLKNGNTSIMRGGIRLTDNYSRYKQHVWKFLIRKKFIEDNHLYFPEKVSSDDCISVLWQLTAKKITFCDYPLYYWVKRDNSESAKKVEFMVNDLSKTIKSIIRYHAYLNLNKESKKVFISFFKYLLYYEFIFALTSHAENLEMCCAKIKKLVQILDKR